MENLDFDPDLLVLLVPLPLLFGIFLLIALFGFFVVQPRTQVLVLRWGKPKITFTDEGIHYSFPIGRRLMRVTSSVISADLPKMMVVEASGSPIEVSGVCSYRIVNAEKALLEFENINNHVSLLATAVLKNVCSQYPYDSPDPRVPCLRKENDVIARQLIHELQTLVHPAGVEVFQLRTNDLAYAPEIAQSMLLRQQAVALVDARRTIVQGALGTVSEAVQRMVQSGLANDRAATESFAENLLMVLASGERVQTVLPVEIASIERSEG